MVIVDSSGQPLAAIDDEDFAVHSDEHEQKRPKQNTNT